MLMNTPNMYLVMQPIEFIGRKTEYEILTRIRGYDSAFELIEKVKEERRELEFDLEVVNRAMVETPEDMLLAINLLPGSLENIKLMDYLDEIVSSRHRKRENITLEINEDTNCLSRNVQLNITRFKSMGYNISLDDFSGRECDYNLLDIAKPRAVKFDRSLVGNWGVQSIVRLLNERGLDTIIEGIETEADVKMARDLGYKGLQGYYIGRPTPVLTGERAGNMIDTRAVAF